MTVILTFEFVHVHICQRSVGWPFKWKLDYSQYLFPLIFAFFPSRQTLTLLPLNNTWLINKPGKHFPTFKVLKISPHRCCSGTISGWSCFIFCQYFLTSTPSHERLPLVLKKLQRKMFIKQKVVGKCWKSHSKGMVLFSLCKKIGKSFKLVNCEWLKDRWTPGKYSIF